MADNQQPQPSASLRSPVEEIKTDQPEKGPEEGIALCLSGGGFRAMLFHVGSLWRLNQAGLLPKLDRISSVSGGSITAAVLGANWGGLGFDARGAGQKFEDLLVKPVRTLASHTIDVVSILGGIFTGSVADKVADAYRKYLFGTKTLQDLPDKPRFVFNSTNVQSKALWRFSKPHMRDYRVGEVKSPGIELAVAVGASSAFPPVLSPVGLRSATTVDQLGIRCLRRGHSQALSAGTTQRSVPIPGRRGLKFWGVVEVLFLFLPAPLGVEQLGR